MKVLPKPPFFETSVKNYIYGDDVLNYAKAVDKAAIKYDVDALFIAPYTEIRRIAEQTERLIILAPYMDTLRPGRGIADVLPEAIKAAGAKGVLLNHCERPMSLPAIKETIDRANELDLFTFACADSIVEAKAIAQFHPDIINPEPSELIGTTEASDMTYVKQTLEVIRNLFPDILVEQAAGITKGIQIYDFIMVGNDGAGSASGILKSPDPLALLDEMVSYVRKAKDDLARQKK
ncbi:MAG: triose-phosphate isomerase [Clostridiaceae bacterium]|jgi:triosephosphate isomerase|nr:triose-phosphate isomerase [Eubacteriales bacterium]NLV48276.1 triose-phosphate isomerase [Clostridiaceae bacterium]